MCEPFEIYSIPTEFFSSIFQELLIEFLFIIAESEKNHLRNPHHLLLCPHSMELEWSKGHRDTTHRCLDPDLDKSCGLGD